MANNVLADRVMVTSTTTGTGTYSLGSAVTGYLDFALGGITTGQRVPYLVVNDLAAPTLWEMGEGVWTSGAPATLSRALIRRNSSGTTSAINWAAGTRYVLIAASGARLPYRDDAGHLPMAAGRITGLGAGTVADDAARLDQLAWQEISETVVSVATGSVVFTMPTGFTRAKVEYQDVVASFAGGLYARVSVDNAVSYLTAAADYHRVILYSGGASGTTIFSTGGTSSLWDQTSAVATTAGFFGDIEVQLGSGARAFQGRAVYFDSSANMRQVQTGGVVLGGGSAAITHLLLAINGGNINSGRFRFSGART